MERATCGSAALRCALISEVLQRTGCAARIPAFLENADLKVFAHAKLAPMVQGLFPQREHMIILERLERSIVFLTPATIASTLEKTPWLKTAWNLANLYLTSFDAKTALRRCAKYCWPERRDDLLTFPSSILMPTTASTIMWFLRLPTFFTTASEKRSG